MVCVTVACCWGSLGRRAGRNDGFFLSLPTVFQKFRTDVEPFPDGRAKVGSRIGFADMLKINSLCCPYCILVFTKILDTIEPCDTTVTTQIYNGYVECLPSFYEGEVVQHSYNEIQQMQFVLSANRRIQEKDQTR